MISQAYQGACIILTTKHAKSVAIAPPFWDILGASVIEYVTDTDKLGTFSGEVERQGSALECAQRKCEWSLNHLGDRAQYAIASEGSFGPHPSIPFLACDHEILYFIDRKRDFHLHLSLISCKTNYQMQTIDSWETLQDFAAQAQFPSHGLILQPDSREAKQPIFKGVETFEDLEEAFHQSRKLSANGKVWVETDMRAQFNPSRMQVIKELAEKLAHRLGAACPKCQTPGWGKIRSEEGLPCRCCGAKTEMIKASIFGCTNCCYEQTVTRDDGLMQAEPVNCPDCNP